MLAYIAIFLIVNFAGLAIGSIFTNSGVRSDWYRQLQKAPWTPPGWVFGATWSTIMICFAIYMAFALKTDTDPKTLYILFSLQWLLNALWNPIFFKFHKTGLALFTILALTAVVLIISYRFYYQLNLKSLLIAPYLIWLFIAISLNAYVVIKN
ncbi:MAG: tryptophan-rich sensory protein [Flavobacteriaceae bacterium]|nr:tryptophan-rich sensory protein [Flavobacteriaceae bacterium]